MNVFLQDLNASFNACDLPCCKNCTAHNSGIDCKFFENVVLNCSSRFSGSAFSIFCNATYQPQMTHQSFPFASKSVFIVAYSLILIIALPSNLIVCCILGRKKQFNVADTFIFAIAVTGLLSTMIGPTHQIVLFSTDTFVASVFNSAISKIAAFLFDCLSMFEAWLLAEVAGDRLWAIKRPFQWRAVTIKPRVIMLILTLFVIVSVTLPVSSASHLGWRNETKLAYFYMLTFIGYGLPLVSTVLLYAVALRALRNNRPDSASAGNRRVRSDRKAVRLFMTVVLFFVLSAFPHLIIDIYYNFNKDKAQSMLIHESALVFHTLNPCINPFIYSKMDHDIRMFSRRLWDGLKNVLPSSDGGAAPIVTAAEKSMSPGAGQYDNAHQDGSV